MNPIPITTVRYDRATGLNMLQQFVFGGIYAGRRAPRGVDPELVSEFIRERLKPDSSAMAWLRAGDVLRFYERADVLDHIRQPLRGQEASYEDLLRSAYALHIFGDLGTREHAAAAASYFDRVLTPHKELPGILEAALDTLVALAPASSIDKLYARISGDLQALAQDPAARTQFLKLSDQQRNKAPAAMVRMQAKARLLAADPASRRAELVRIYLGESSFAEDLMVEWAGRMLRREAMEADPAPVIAEFARVIDAADGSQMEKVDYEFIVHRSAQAILYLRGKLSPAARAKYVKIRQGPRNFLWDDLPEGPQPPARDEDEEEEEAEGEGEGEGEAD